MPAYAPDFNDPLGLLVHCHHKIESHLRNLERVADAITSDDPAVRLAAIAAAERASAHFATPGVKHTEDEELSLFPRLRARKGADVSGVLEVIESLESQHRSAEHCHEAFDVLLAALPRDRPATPELAERVRHSVQCMCQLYRPHMQLENEVIFPAAARMLDAAELAELGAEMRERRKEIMARMHRG
jgi:hemerythrin-like domain-containing protein